MPGVVKIPKGVLKLPVVLTENTSGVTCSDGVANAESIIVEYQVPITEALVVRQGDRFYLYIADSTPTQITSGIVRVYVASPDKVSMRHLVFEGSPDELDAGGTPEDREKWAVFPMGFVVGPQQYLLITYEGSSTVEGDNTKVRITGEKLVRMA